MVLDCDGTLADTEPIADDTWRETLRELGYEPTDEDFHAVIGHPYAHTYAHFATRVALPPPDELRDKVRARFRARLERELTLHEDAEQTLRALVAEGVPVAIASSSVHDHVRRVLELGGVADLVEVVVGADDVERHKPHPEPYLRAVEALGADPSRSSAAEDTGVGVAAATAGGLFTVGVLRPGAPDGSLAGADRVVRRLTPDSLCGLVG